MHNPLLADTGGIDPVIDKMRNQSRHRFWLKLAAGLLFAAVAYGGGYAVLVRPHYPMASFIDPKTGSGGGPGVSRYTIGGEFARALFGPAHRIDRRLRPGVWQTVVEPKLTLCLSSRSGAGGSGGRCGFVRYNLP